MSHNKSGPAKGTRKAANKMRAARRLRSYSRITLKRLRHVLKSNGLEAAKRYAEANGLKLALQNLLEEQELRGL